MSDRARLRLLAGVVAVLIVVVTAVSCSSTHDGDTYRVTIDRGAAVRGDSSALTSLPHRYQDAQLVLEFADGDTLTIVNDDSVPHAIGFLNVRPGETLTHRFTQTGRFEGDCTLLGDSIVIDIT